MALQPGIRDDPAPPAWNPLLAFGRLVGFVVLAGLGLAIIAAVVLIPAYARLEMVRYQRANLEAQNKDAQTLITAYDRLLAEAPKDEVLTRRLAKTQLGLWPRNETVVPSPNSPPVPPGMVLPVRHARPQPPPAWLMRADAKLQDAPTRRGLFLVAVCVIAGALFLFAPPAMSGRSPASSEA